MLKVSRLIALCSSLLVTVTVAFAEIKLSFGVYATDKPTEVVKKFKPVLKALEQDLTQALQEPARINIQVASSYEKGVYDLSEGRVDFARLGPASYVESKRLNPRIEILATESKNGSKRFNGLICVTRSSPITHVSDLKGKSFAFGNVRSTIGRYLSQLYLLENGIRLNDLSRSAYLDRHDKVGYAVASGKFDAGALKESTYNRLIEKGVPLRPIATFENVTKPWLARSGLEPRILNALRSTLLAIKNPQALKAMGKDGFVPGEDHDYRVVRKAVERNGEFYTASADSPHHVRTDRPL